jgi:hypothetical protein
MMCSNESRSFAPNRQAGQRRRSPFAACARPAASPAPSYSNRVRTRARSARIRLRF